MKQPIVMVALRQAAQLCVARRDLRDAERSLVAMAKSQRVLAERHTALQARYTEALRLLSVPISEMDTAYGAECDAFLSHALPPLSVVEGPRSAP